MPHHILIHSKNKPSATTVAACAPRKRKAEKDAPSSNLSRQNKRVQCDNPCDSSAQHEYQPCMPMTRKRKAMAGCDSQIDPGSDDDGENAYARPCKNPKVAPEALAMMNDIKKHGIEAVQKKWSQHRMGETTKQDKKRLAAKINRALIKSKAPLIRTPAWSFPSETGSFTASTETPQQKAERLAIEAETERKVTQAARMAEIKEATILSGKSAPVLKKSHRNIARNPTMPDCINRGAITKPMLLLPFIRTLEMGRMAHGIPSDFENRKVFDAISDKS